jgi:hypothetical protein
LHGELHENAFAPSHATGFMVSPMLLLTNHHVLLTPDHARRTSVVFGPTASERRWADLSPDVFYLSDEHLDFALVAVSPLSPPYAFSPIALCDPLSPHCHPHREGWRELQCDSAVRSLQRPSGLAVRCEVRGSVRALQWLSESPTDCPKSDPRLPDMLLYNQTTEGGSSGSPVFDTQGRLIALHSGWVFLDDARDAALAVEVIHKLPGAPQGKRAALNRGVYIGRLLQHLRARYERMSAEEKGREAGRMLHAIIHPTFGMATASGAAASSSVDAAASLLASPPQQQGGKGGRGATHTGKIEERGNSRNE